MEHKIIVEEKEKFLKVYCSEGCFITDWDREDIKNFNSFRVMYCPKTIDLSRYYCITEEENSELMKKQEEEIRLNNELE